MGGIGNPIVCVRGGHVLSLSTERREVYSIRGNISPFCPTETPCPEDTPTEVIWKKKEVIHKRERPPDPTNSRSITGRYRKPVTSGNNIRFIVVHYRPFSIYFVFLGERRPTFMVGTDFRRCTYVADIIIYTSVNTYWGLLNTY